MSDEKTQVPSKLDEVVDTLVATLKETKEFVIEQAPDVAKQMIAERQVEIKYNLIINAMVLGGAIVTAFACYLAPQTSDGALFIRGILGVCAVITIFPGVGCTLESMKEAAQLKAAPKVFLLNKLKRLVK